MTSQQTKPILVTGAGGKVGGKVVEILWEHAYPVRALLRTENARADALRKLGAEVVVGDLTELEVIHRAIDGCDRAFFSMAATTELLEASILFTAIAKHYGMEVVVNHSQVQIPFLAHKL